MKANKIKLLGAAACSCALAFSMMASALAASDKSPPGMKPTSTPTKPAAAAPIKPAAPVVGKEVTLKGIVIPGGVLKAEDGILYLISSEGKGGAVMAEEGRKVTVQATMIEKSGEKMLIVKQVEKGK